MLTTVGSIFRGPSLTLCRYYASEVAPVIDLAVKRPRGRPRIRPIEAPKPPRPPKPPKPVPEPKRRGRPPKPKPLQVLVPVLEPERPPVQLPPIRRLPSSALDKGPGSVELPPHLLWREHFSCVTPTTRGRVSIANPETAKILAENFAPPKSRDKVIIEAYPGPGALTRALMELPRERISKIIIMEDHKPYLAYLRPLAELDDRIHIIEKSAWSWESYTELEARGLLNDVEKIPWDGGVHPKLEFISHLPLNVLGEQLASQLFRSIPDQQWLFQYGRVPMQFILSDWVWQRIAPTKPNLVCKLSIIAQAVASCSLTVPHYELTPYNNHFHPVAIHAEAASSGIDASAAAEAMKNRKVGYPFQVMGVIPKGETAEDAGKAGGRIIRRGMMEKWDFVLRRLFVLRASPLKKVMPSLAPGASVLLKKLSGPDVPKEETVNVNAAVRTLKPRDWALIVKAFHEWHFAPEDLMITDNLNRDRFDRNAERK